ncbi:hypothetical protein LTR95_012617 [Oleoguttula sp. CCFEE 5521]
MASSFDTKLQRIAELSGRVQKYQGRVKVDDEAIVNLEKGIKDYEGRLQNARAARDRHFDKLGLLKREVKELAAGLDAASDDSEDASRDTVMSDSGDQTQNDTTAATTMSSMNTTARTSTSFKTSTPKFSPPNSFPSIHENYPTVIKFQGQWHEITCLECGCNSSLKSKFLDGVSGMRNHFRQQHAANGSGKLDIFGCCALRPVSDTDVGLLEQGLPAFEQPVEVRTQVDTTGVGRKARALVATSHQRILEDVYSEFPTVILLDGAAFELTCKVCGTNSLKDHEKFLKGVKGFKTHYMAAHPQDVGQMKIEELCNMRPVSIRDQGYMKVGLDPMDHSIYPLRPQTQKKAAGLQPQMSSSVGHAPGIDGNVTVHAAAQVASMLAAADFENDVNMKGLFSNSEGD